MFARQSEVFLFVPKDFFETFCFLGHTLLVLVKITTVSAELFFFFHVSNSELKNEKIEWSRGKYSTTTTVQVDRMSPLGVTAKQRVRQQTLL